MLSLRLLGPVSLLQDGQPLPLPTHKAQALLLLLALGGPSHRARLATWLWPQTDDSAGRRNLRRELARLRDAGAGDALLSQGEVLALAPTVQCDALAFATLADGGQAAEALALWRGPLADGLQTGATDAFDDWLAGERRRLASRRRQLLAAEAEAAEAAGHLPQALATLQQLLADDPLQEHLHRQVMRLHAAAGDRSAALAQHARCREALLRELGLAPGDETEALAARIRAGLGVASTPVAAAHPAAARVPAPPADGGAWPVELPLTGRHAAWQALQTAWQAQQLVVIEGEAGVGKTRLARDFAASRGAYALAQCRRSDAGVPYASFTRLLRSLAGQSLPQAGLPDWVRLELAHVLPELGAGPQRIGSADEQRRFCEACAAAWQQLTAGNFDTVVLDDWHLADDASRALMGFIAEQRREGVAASPVREIHVQRPEWASGDAAARQQALQQAAGACVLRLAPLDADGVYALVKQLSGADDPRRFAQRLERATGGNPFFLGETLRQWRGLGLLGVGPDGVWQTPFDDATQDYAELPVPDTVRDTVIARVQRQPEAVRRVLEAAALASEPFTPALLAGACALSEVEALDAIEGAVGAQLLRERQGGFAFSHDLVQAALESALGPDRARLVHRRLALGGEAAGQDSADIARHWEAGGEPARAVAHRMAAAEAALALYADADAQAHWQAALDDQPTLAQRVRILGQRWQILSHRGDQPGLLAAVQALDAARDQARATPGAEAVALDAELHAAEILAHSQRNEDALARTLACLAHPALGPVARAQALQVQSQALSRLGRTDEARAATEAALAAGGLPPLQQGDLLHALSYTHFLAGAPQASLDHARRALAVWQAAGARRQMATAQASIGRALDMLDAHEAAWSALEDALAQAAALRMVDLQRTVANNLANNRINHGGPARAIQVIREAQALAPHFTRPSTPVFYLGILVQAHAQMGELGTALALADETLDRALALDETLTLADCLLMTLGVRSALGDADGVQRLLGAMAGRSLAGLGYFEGKVALELAGLALDRGRPDEARAHLAAVGDVAAMGIPSDRAAARQRLAQLALAEGDANAALRWLAPLADDVLYTEVQAGSCSLRLAAHLRLGRTDAAALALADQALAGERQGRQLPALARLQLLRTRGAAARLAGDAATADHCVDAAEALQTRLAASLGRWQALAPALGRIGPA